MIAYLSTNLWTLWTIIAVLCLIIELGSGDFFVTCFAIGALCALVATLAGLPLWVHLHTPLTAEAYPQPRRASQQRRCSYRSQRSGH